MIGDRVQLAIPLLCDLAHAGQTARRQLFGVASPHTACVIPAQMIFAQDSQPDFRFLESAGVAVLTPY